MLGAIAGTAIKLQMSAASSGGPSGETMGEGDGDPSGTVERSVAWQYAEAYQEGDWGKVHSLTPWVQERLDYVQETEGPEAVATERDALMATIGTRTLDENYLRETGVDDQYVFTPSARITFDSFDEGRDDLEAPVARRTWFKVVYSVREKAMLDRDSIPIRSLRVGVNVSRDGLVLKANIIGNLDIDWNSIKYDWPSP